MVGVDPRVKRTRALLRQGLEDLLRTKEFDAISVQDITDAATLNRATFYDHYSDKYSLLECMVAHRFTSLLEARGVRFDGGCSSALRAMVLGVCDYVSMMSRQDPTDGVRIEPHQEAAVISVVTQFMLEGMEKHPAPSNVAPSMLAAILSWAIYGAAKDWVRQQNRCSSEVMGDHVVGLLEPLFAAAYEGVPSSTR